MEGAPDINPIYNEEEISQPEAAPQTFEEMLEAAKALRLQGVDPFEHADYSESGKPELIRLRDNLQDWENAHDLAMSGIRSVEKAEATVQAAMFWVNAGYTDIDTIKEALDYLRGEKKSLTKDIAPEIRQIIESAIKQLGEMLKSEPLGERMLAEALEKIGKEEYIHAIPLLHELTKNTTYEKYIDKNPDLRSYLNTLLEETRVNWRKQRGF